MKKLIELHKKLDPTLNTLTDWKRDAGICNKIADLTMELLIGDIKEKMYALNALAKSAHLARDKDLVMKAMDKLRQFADETKMEYLQRGCEILERRFSKWSTEFRSGSPPVKREIAFILARLDTVDTDIDVMTSMSEVD